MAQPYNYSIDVPNPLEGFLQGVKIRQTMEQQQQKQLEAQQKKQQEAAFMADLQATIRTPTPERWQALYAKHPMMYEQIGEIRKNTSPAASNLFTKTAMNVLQLDTSGDVAGAIKYVEDAAAAALAGGMNEEAQKLTDLAAGYRRAQDNPEGRRGAVAGLLAIYADKDQYDRLSKVYGFDMPTALAEYQARVRKDGKEEADIWWESQGKFMTTDTDLVDIGEYIRGKRSVTGKPAPQGVTFTRVKPEGGQTGAPSGNFRGQ